MKKKKNQSWNLNIEESADILSYHRFRDTNFKIVANADLVNQIIELETTSSSFTNVFKNQFHNCLYTSPTLLVDHNDVLKYLIISTGSDTFNFYPFKPQIKIEPDTNAVYGIGPNIRLLPKLGDTHVSSRYLSIRGNGDFKEKHIQRGIDFYNLFSVN
jgi:hypothetical protein